MKKTALALALVFSAGCAQMQESSYSVFQNSIAALKDLEGAFKPNHQVPAALLGTWTGQGYQSNTRTTWSIKVRIAQGAASIEYPSLSCGGDLYLTFANETMAVFDEKITFGNSRCVNKGQTVISLTDDGQTRFDWFFNDKHLAAGKLARAAN